MITCEGVGVSLAEVVRHPLPENRQPHAPSIPLLGVQPGREPLPTALSALRSVHGWNRSTLSSPAAEQFVWLTARVLEQRRFAHLFLGGGADAVETALAAYLNEDGGYGHALEPDLRGPVSQPLHTAARAERPGLDRPLRRPARGTDLPLSDRRVDQGGRAARAAPLPARLPGRPLHPGRRRPARRTASRRGRWSDCCTAIEVWHAWLFRATDFCWAAVDALEQSHPYEIEAAVAFLDGVPDRARAEAAADRLGRWCVTQRLVVLDPRRRDEYPWPPVTRRGNTTSLTTTPAPPGRSRARWFSDAEMERPAWTTWRPSSRRTVAGRSTGGSGRPERPWRAVRS